MSNNTEEEIKKYLYTLILLEVNLKNINKKFIEGIDEKKLNELFDEVLDEVCKGVDGELDFLIHDGKN